MKIYVRMNKVKQNKRLNVKKKVKHSLSNTLMINIQQLHISHDYSIKWLYSIEPCSNVSIV